MFGHYRDDGPVKSRLRKTVRKRRKEASRSDALETDKFLLRQVVDNLIPYVQIIQGIFLSRGIKDNKIDLFDLARELLDMKPGLDLDLFKKDGLEGLPNELKSLIGKVADVCAAEGRRCGDIDEMKVVLLNVDNVSKKLVENYHKMYQDGETLPNLVIIKNAFPNISQLHQQTGSLINALHTARNETEAAIDPNTVGLNILAPLNKLSKAPDSFKTKFTAEQIESLSKNNLLAKFTAMKTLEIVHPDLDKIKYEVLIAKFEAFKELILISESHLSDKKQWPMIEKKLRMMTALVDSKLEIDEKRFTSAFLNGFKDLTRLLQESESSFVKETVLKGEDPQKLKDELVPLDSFQKEVKPIHDVLKKVKNIDAAEMKIKTMVNEAISDVEDLKKMEPLHNCISHVQNFKLTIDSKSWLPEASLAEALGDHAKTFAEKFNQVSFELPVYKGLVEKITTTAKISLDDIIEYVQKHQNFDQLDKEVQTLYDSLGQLMTKEMETWIKHTQVQNLVPEAKKWLEHTDAGKTLQCIQDKEISESIKNILEKQIVLPAIQQMKPTDEAIVDIENARNLVKEAYDQYLKWMNSHRKRKTRAAQKQEKVDQSIQITDNLAIAVQFYMDVASAYLLKEEIQKLLAFGQTIDDAIERLKDQDKKIRMKKMWNGKTKEVLKSLPKVVEDFTKTIVSLPEKLEDYKKVFNVTSFDSLDGDINMKVFLDDLRSMNSLLIDQPTAEKLETLDLAFTKAKEKRLNGYQAFLLSLPILSTFQPQNSIGNDENKLGPVGWTCIIVGAVVGLSLSALFIMWLRNFCETRKEKRGAWKAFKMIFPCSEKKPIKDIKVKKFVPIQPDAEEKDEKVEFYRTAEGKVIVKAKTVNFKEKNPTAIKFLETKKEFPKLEKIKKGEMHDGLTRISAADLKKNLSKRQLRLLGDFESTAVEYAKKENDAQAVFQQKEPAENDLIIRFKYRSTHQLKEFSKLKFEELPPCEDDPVISNDFVEYAVGNEKDKYVGWNRLNSDKRSKPADLSERNGKESSKKMKVPEASTKTMKDLAREVSTSSVEVQKTQDSERGAAGKDAVQKEEVGTHGLKITPNLKYRWEMAYELLRDLEEENMDKIQFSDVPGKDYTNDYFEKNKLPRTNGKLNYLYIQTFMTRKRTVQNLGYRTGDEAGGIQAVFTYDLALEILQNARAIFAKEPALLKLTREKLRVVGDIHGTYADMARHVELGLEDTVSSFLFLGDYVDRGPRSIDTLLYLCILKITNPRRFNFLRGNHELRSVNSEYGFLEECMMVYGKDKGFEFWKAANEFFADLPIACIIGNKVWAAHGGISPLMLEGRDFIEKNLVKKPGSNIQYKLFLDVLWSDPDPAFPGGPEIERMFTVNKRYSAASSFTLYGLNTVLEKCRFAFIIRGHQLKLLGHEMCHENKCITTYGGSNHLDEKNLACQTIIHGNLKVEFIRFRNYGDEVIKGSQETILDDDDDDESLSVGSTPNSAVNSSSSTSDLKTAVSKRSKSSAGSSKSRTNSKKSTSTNSTLNSKSSGAPKKRVAKANTKRPSCAPPEVMTPAKPSKSQASEQSKSKSKETVKAKN